MFDTANATPAAPPQARQPDMKIKRFVAADMRTAMSLVRREHGPDAVILSNRRVEQGVEIVAATHFDEAAMQQALRAENAAQQSTDAAQAPTLASARPRTAAEAIMAVVNRRKNPTTAAAPAQTSAPILRHATVTPLQRDDSRPAPPIAQAASQQPLPPALTPAPHIPVVAPPDVTPHYATLPPSADEPPVVPAFRPASSQPVAPPAAPEPEPEAAAPVVPPPSATPAPVTAPQYARYVIGPSPVAFQPLVPPAPAPAPAPVPVPTNAIDVATPVQPSIADIPPPAPAPQAVSGSKAPLSVIASKADDETLKELRREVVGMRQLIEREMQRFTDERLRGSPIRASALDLMDEYGFDPGLARDVATQIPTDIDPARARGLILGLLSKKLPIAPADPMETGGVIALVGPTGAGKTTTIAKLASRFIETHAPRDVALVTTDTHRIGAREQLYGFGRQLGIAVHEATSGPDLNRLLARLTDYKLVLIDTAGLGQRDRALAAQLQWLRAGGQITTLLVLPANTSFQDMDEAVRRFSAANPQGVVLTKLDETGRFGSTLSVVVDHRLPITWVTDGQSVPEDLYRASAANLVLRLEDLRRAADMPSNPELNHAVA